MFRSIIDAIFGCSHRRTSFPQTPARPKGVVQVRELADMDRSTYVVCLDCGKEFSYDWKAMKVGAPLEVRVRPTTPPSVQEATD